MTLARVLGMGSRTAKTDSSPRCFNRDAGVWIPFPPEAEAKLDEGETWATHFVPTNLPGPDVQNLDQEKAMGRLLPRGGPKTGRARRRERAVGSCREWGPTFRKRRGGWKQIP